MGRLKYESKQSVQRVDERASSGRVRQRFARKLAAVHQGDTGDDYRETTSPVQRGLWEP